MIYQVRIIYNKESMLASSYCAEFFKFCGFLVYEETEKNFSGEKQQNEILINLLEQDFGDEKEFLKTIVHQNVQDFEELYPLIDVFVELSLHKVFLEWMYFKPQEINENFIKILEAAGRLIERNDNNIYVQISIIYLRYYILKIKDIIQKAGIKNRVLLNAFLKEHPNIEPIFYRNFEEEILNIKEEVFKKYSNIYSLYVLYGNIMSIPGTYYRQAIEAYSTALRYVNNDFQEEILYNMVLVYINYDANLKDVKICCERILNNNANSILGLSGLRKALIKQAAKTDKEREVKRTALTDNIIKIFEILEVKEREILLNPKELSLKVSLCYELLYYNAHQYEELPEDTHKYIISFEKYYDQINSAQWFEVFYSMEEAKQKRKLIQGKFEKLFFYEYTLLGAFYRDALKDKQRFDYYMDKAINTISKKY